MKLIAVVAQVYLIIILGSAGANSIAGFIKFASNKDVDRNFECFRWVICIDYLALILANFTLKI